MYSPVWVFWLTPASHRMVMRDPDLSILCFCHPVAPQGALLWAMEGRREGGEAPAYEIQNDTSNFLSLVHQCSHVTPPDARRVWKCNPWKGSHFLARFYFMEELWGIFSLNVWFDKHHWGQFSTSISYSNTSWGQHTDYSLFQLL